MVTMTEDGAAWLVDDESARKVKGRAVWGRVDTAINAGGTVTALANDAFGDYRVDGLPASGPKPVSLKTVHDLAAACDFALYGTGGGGLTAQGYTAFANTGPDKSDGRAFFAAMDEAKLGIAINSRDSFYRLGWTFYDDATDIPGVVFTRASAAPALDSSFIRHDFAVDVPRETDIGWMISRGGNNLVKVYQDRKIGLNGVTPQGNGIAKLVDKSADLAGTKYAAFIPDGMVYEIDNTGDLVNTSYLQFDTLPTVATTSYTVVALMWVAAAGMTARTDVTNAPDLAEASSSSLTPDEVPLSFVGTSISHQPYAKAAAGSKIWCAYIILGEGVDAPPLPILAQRPTTFTGADAGNMASSLIDPTDLTGVTKRGDAAAVATVVDDTADEKLNRALPAKTAEKVYRLDNTAGTGSANQIAATTATTIGQTYVPFAWIRTISGTGRLGIDNAPGGFAEVNYTKETWKLVVGDAFVATSTSHVTYVKASAASVVDWLYSGLWHGSTLPDTIRGQPLTTLTYADDQATVPVPTADGLVVEWLGMTTVADVVSSAANIGVSGIVPWDGTYVRARSRRAGETLPTATPQSAVAFLKESFTKRYAGTVLDLTKYPTLAFSEDFESGAALSTILGDGATDAKKLSSPGHSSYGGGVFVPFSQDIYGIYSIVTGDGGHVLRITGVKDGGGHWRSGGISTINDAGVGFTAINGYWEWRSRYDQAPGVWGADWVTGQATAANDNHPEIDVLEFYGTDPGHEHGTIHDWQPFQTIDGFRGTHWQCSRTNGFDFDPATFYNMGLEITDKWIILYRDRVETRRAPRYPSVGLRGLHALATLAILPTEAAAATGPVTRDLSYLKVWTA